MELTGDATTYEAAKTAKMTLERMENCMMVRDQVELVKFLELMIIPSLSERLYRCPQRPLPCKLSYKNSCKLFTCLQFLITGVLNWSKLLYNFNPN